MRELDGGKNVNVGIPWAESVQLCERGRTHPFREKKPCLICSNWRNIPIKGADHLMPEEEMMRVQIHDATPNDADGVRHVQQRTWLATYPNAELGITKEDIEARFHASSEEAIKRRQTQQ